MRKKSCETGAAAAQSVHGAASDLERITLVREQQPPLPLPPKIPEFCTTTLLSPPFYPLPTSGDIAKTNLRTLHGEFDVHHEHTDGSFFLKSTKNKIIENMRLKGHTASCAQSIAIFRLYILYHFNFC